MLHRADDVVCASPPLAPRNYKPLHVALLIYYPPTMHIERPLQSCTGCLDRVMDIWTDKNNETVSIINVV